MKRQTILIKGFEFFYDAIDYTNTIDYEEIIKGYDVSSFEMTITHCACLWVVEIKARKEVIKKMNNITRKEPNYAKIRAIGYFRSSKAFRINVEKYINRTNKRNKHYTYIDRGGKR